jgi:hypothetical protein
VSSNLLRSLPIRLPIPAAGINKYIFFSGKKLRIQWTGVGSFLVVK